MTCHQTLAGYFNEKLGLSKALDGLFLKGLLLQKNHEEKKKKPTHRVKIYA